MRSLAAAIILATAGAATAAGPTHASLPTDHTPRLPVETHGGAAWQHPFSLVAGGGLRPARPGVIAGDADLGQVHAAVRDGAGQVVLAAQSGLWRVAADGRLRTVGGVPHPRAVSQLTTRADGSVALAVDRDVFVIASAADRARRFAHLHEFEPLGIGTDAGGDLLAVAGGRQLRRQADGSLVPVGPPLWEADGIRTAVGVAAAPDGQLIASLSPNGGATGDPEQDDSSLQHVTADGRARTLLQPPATQALRSLAGLQDGRALLATNASTEGDLDPRPLELAAGPTVDRQRFSYGVGEEFFGWIARRRVLVRSAGGHLQRTRRAGPPADWIAPDGAHDVLVVSGTRVWSTRRQLSAPNLAGLWRGHVAVRLGARATVQVTVRDATGRVVRSTRPRRLPVGRSVVPVRGLPHHGLLRVTVHATRPGSERVASSWANAGPERLAPARAAATLRVIARRLNVGFEGAVSHGVDSCRPVEAQTVTCRWATGGSDAPPTQRTVRLTLRPAGTLLHVSSARPLVQPGPQLLGAPFNASA